MTGLSKITDKILEEARADAAAKLAEADARCAEIAAEAARRASELRAKIEEDAKREAVGILSRTKSGEAVVRRNTVLEARAALIDEAFDTAKKEILHLSEDRYLELLVMILGSCLRRQIENERESRELYGEEDVPEFEAYEVLLCERDLHRLGDRLIEALRRTSQVELSALTRPIVLGERAVAIDGGLILRCGATELNCSLSTLLHSIRPELEANVARRLFPEKKGSG